MATFLEMFVNFALIGLIVTGVLIFGQIVQSDNQVETTLLENSRLNGSFTALQIQLDEVRDTSQSQRELFERENPTITLGSLALKSIVSSGKVFTAMLVGIFNAIIVLPESVLGIDPVVTGVISGIIIVSILIGLWVLYKLGG